VTHFSISLSESSLSTAADSVVRNVLHKIGSDWDNQQRRLVSPFPSTGNVTTHNAVAPTQQYFNNEFQYDISSSSISGSENGNDQQPDDSQPHPPAPVKTDPAQDDPSGNEPEVKSDENNRRSLVRTSVSLDRVEKILAEKKEELSTSSSDDEKDENNQKPKSAKSLTSR